jgi:spermidine/putrescine transport system ATP-binding protein
MVGDPVTLSPAARRGSTTTVARPFDSGTLHGTVRPDFDSSPDSAPEIRLSNVTKRFGEVTAVDDVSLTVGSGEFFSLLGPSGCGKTTTLRMLGGFDLPTSGRIELRGREVTFDPPDKRPVNMVFQSYALFPHLDVAGNIAFGLRRRGVDRSEERRRTAEILDKVHLGGYERRRIHELSGGQQQRVALARALVNEPQVLLLDEPLGALDLKLRKRLQLELKRIQMDVGITFVYVTHDQEEALTMSDRIAVMHHGRVQQVGRPDDLYDRPTNSFVADFIGSTNLLNGTVEAVEADQAVVRLDSGDRCVVAPLGRRAGQLVQLSVRPESIAIAGAVGRAEEPGPPDRLPAEVEQVAYLGSAVQYQVRTAGGLGLTVLAAKNGSRFSSGDAVALAWSPADALVVGDRSDPMEEAS